MNYQLKTNQNFTKAKILRIVKDLVKKRLIIIGSKLVKDTVLENTLRRQIYEYVLNHPGSTNYDLRKAFDVGANQILWHLNFLIKFEFIKIIKIEKHKAIFSFDSDPKYHFLLEEGHTLKFHPQSKVIPMLEDLRFHNN